MSDNSRTSLMCAWSGREIVIARNAERALESTAVFDTEEQAAAKIADNPALSDWHVYERETTTRWVR